MRRLYPLSGLIVVLAGCGGGAGAPPDTTPPVISQIALERTNTGLSLTATVQDTGTGVATVAAIVTAGNQIQTIGMTLETANRYRAILPANTTRVKIRAQDGAGNRRETSDIVAPPPNPPF